jgi:hypothetical protein
MVAILLAFAVVIVYTARTRAGKSGQGIGPLASDD